MKLRIGEQLLMEGRKWYDGEVKITYDTYLRGN